MLPNQTQQDDERCSGCSESIDETNERYAFGDEVLLCWSCAVERGGIYDTEHECWVNEPEVRDLLPLLAP